MTDFEKVFYQVFDNFKGNEKRFSHLSMVTLARDIMLNLPKDALSEPKVIFCPWTENKPLEKVKEKVKIFERCYYGTYSGKEFYIVSDCSKKTVKLYFVA